MCYQLSYVSYIFLYTGPSVLEVFNTLLRHLRVSVDNKHNDPHKMQDEKNFQEAIINTIGLWNLKTHRMFHINVG